ncbi:hypothetical protein chiPu_0000420 [Chiloscyllium punctatum]|uniref:Uncharacterized protein n=1 Tax=Chiloscyllium punctatum TaxID=137246 RepID=A0A401RV96_CHIPU|nr:hypothetical protein [Chiloscyllium punctatum]
MVKLLIVSDERFTKLRTRDITAFSLRLVVQWNIRDDPRLDSRLQIYVIVNIQKYFLGWSPSLPGNPQDCLLKDTTLYLRRLQEQKFCTRVDQMAWVTCMQREKLQIKLKMKFRSLNCIIMPVEAFLYLNQNAVNIH